MRLPWFQSRAMVGGLHFGRPAWNIQTWAAASDTGQTLPSTAVRVLPTDRQQLVELLQQICPEPTGPWMTPPAEQIMAAADRPLRWLILNLLPTQPESLLPAAVTCRATEYFSAGWRLIHTCLDQPRTIAAMNRESFPDRTALRRCLRSMRTGCFRIRVLANRYPQGHPAILLRSLLNRTPRRHDTPVPSPAGRQPPPGDDLVMVDALTCWTIGKFLHTGRTHSRPVQVFANDKEPQLAEALIGSSVADFLHSLGLPITGRRCIRNGMLAGELIDPQAAKIRWDTDMLSLCPICEPEPVTDCIRCGWCVQTCPVGLNPVALWAGAKRVEGLAVADPHEATACIDCGLCSYVCPTRLPLAATIREIKTAR